MLFNIIPAEWAVAFVTGLVSYVGAKIWNRASAKQKALLDAALGEARAVITQLVYTAEPGVTVEQIIIRCKGALKIQLAKRGIDTNNKAIDTLTSLIIAEGVQLFVSRHPSPTELKLPVQTKLGG